MCMDLFRHMKCKYSTERSVQNGKKISANKECEFHVQRLS